ncbi:MAG: alpha/beta hydrolase [Gammaproteobacteria bacterium]|nr:alpha/beta hydrolase [Gammaproteobacteria bacterium]
MHKYLKIGIVLLIFNTCLVTASANTANYAYPLENPYAATILGTPKEFKAELPDFQRIPSKEYTLHTMDSRTIPDVFWYHRRGMDYAISAQNKKAPMVIAIAGTGASFRSEKMKLFQRAFYHAGFHVITLSSPTFSNFMVNASTTAIPGNLQEDSVDLYKVMQQILNKHSELEVSDYNLIGYSLGASQAAFVSQIDDQEKVIGFNKVLMINPPLNLMHSVKLLDNMLTANIPGGVDNFNAFFKDFMSNVTAYHRDHQKLDMTGVEFFYEAYRDKNPSDERMQALIGIAFRMSSSDMIFTSDVQNKLGYLVPKNTVLGTTTSLTEYSKASRRLGFTDYVEEVYLPYYTKANGKSKETIIAESSLLSIQDYLQNSDKIGLMHNHNDPILMEGEIDTIKSLFPGRAKVYPFGGHCGNMEYKDNVAYMVDFFSGSKK